MRGINWPIPPEWENYITQSDIDLEEIPDVLYDTATYVDNTTLTLNFFNVARGDLSLSNLAQGGFLSNPQSFLVEYVRVYFRNTVRTDDQGAAGAFASQFNDVVLLVNTGRLLLTIGEKKYGPWPLNMLPAGSFVKGSMAAAGGEAANLVSDYAQLDGPFFRIEPYLMIAPMQQFNIDLIWPSAVDLTGNVAIQLSLEGKRSRAVQ